MSGDVALWVVSGRGKLEVGVELQEGQLESILRVIGGVGDLASLGSR